jgi:hypothetical protein
VEKSPLHFWFCGVVSWQLGLGKTHTLWQNDAEAVEQRGLGGIRSGHAAQTDVAVGWGWQHDVLGLNARELFEQDTRCIAEPSAISAQSSKAVL